MRCGSALSPRKKPWEGKLHICTYSSISSKLMSVGKRSCFRIDGDDRPTSTTVVDGLSLPAQPPLVEQVDELTICIGKLGELLSLSSNYRAPVISGGIWVAPMTRAMGWICIALTARSSYHQGTLLQIWPASLDFPGWRTPLKDLNQLCLRKTT